MSTQIALYKLDIIRKILVANRFNKKKAENLKNIGKLVYDATVAKIPKPIMALFIKEESDFIIYDHNSENAAMKLSTSKQRLTFLGGRHIVLSNVF